MKPQPRGEPNLAIRALADGKTVELDILDGIGWWYGGITAKSVAAALKEAGSKKVRVRINSPGGEVGDGIAIYNLLKAHKGGVEVDVIGMALSVASIIAMAGTPLRMAENALMMIHDPWVVASGNAADLRHTADTLDKDAQALAQTYVRKTGKQMDEVLKLMADETWMTAAEAVEAGFADESVEAVPSAAALLKPHHVDAFGWLPEKAAPFIDETPAETVPGGWRAVAMQRKQRAAAAPKSTTIDVRINPDDLANMRGAADAVHAAVVAQRETSAGSAPASNPPAPEAAPEPHPEIPMPFAKSLLALLALADDADDKAVEGAVRRIKAQAQLGADVESLTGQQGAAALGAVRALKETAASYDDLAADVAKVKVSLCRRDFDAAIAEGLKGPKRKLSPMTAKHYEDRFVSALADGGDPEAVVKDLRGFLAVAPTLVSTAAVQPNAGAAAGDTDAMRHEGKTFADLKPIERARLKRDNPELYNLMRDDALAAGAI